MPNLSQSHCSGVRPSRRTGLAGAVSLFLLGSFLLGSSPAEAATIVVQPDGNGDVATIQDAVNQAESGDLVSLTDGVFSGPGNRDIVLPETSLRIESVSGAAGACEIDCGGSSSEPHRAFLIASTGTADIEIANITIHSGFVPDGEVGGAVLVQNADPTFTGCVFENNSSGDFAAGGSIASELGASPSFLNCIFETNTARQGGAIAVFESGASFDGCVFASNEAGIDGGAIYALMADLDLRECTFSENTARFGGAVFMDNDSDVSVDSSSFVANSAGLVGGAVVSSASDPVFTGCTFVSNSAMAFLGLGGGALWCSFDSSPRLENCLLAVQAAGGAIGCEKASGPVLVCCNLFDNEGGDWVEGIESQLGVDGNISSDPFFCDRENGDLKVAAESPCLPAGNECSVTIGRFGQGCVTIPVLESSWGEIKSRFIDR